MKELSKSIPRRQRNPNFITKYFVGNGIDIGGFPDPLSLYREFFPLIDDIKIWDKQDGDAQLLNGLEDESLNFVHSSHCLEHLVDPFEGIANWFRVLKPGGHLITTVPEEDLYEQEIWPPDKNLDHKWTFTICKVNSWSPKSINIFDLVKHLGSQCDVRSLHVEDSGFRSEMPRFDQTLTPTAESAIEFIFRKKTSIEMQNKTSFGLKHSKIEPNLRRYYNQYRDDMKSMKENNVGIDPFNNFTEL